MTRSTVIKLVVESPLSLRGEGRGSLQEVLKVPIYAKDGLKYWPIIPATSIKGAFRGITELLGSSIGSGSDDPRRKLMASHKRERGKISHVFDIDALLNEIGPREREFLERIGERGSDYLEYLACPICRLFGAPGVAAKVRFSDAIPSSEPVLRQMTRTSIDRKSMKVKEERLFTEELVVSGEFRFVIVVDDLDSLEEELFNNVLTYLGEEGLQLGGGKSIGRGRMKVYIGPWENR